MVPRTIHPRTQNPLTLGSDFPAAWKATCSPCLASVNKHSNGVVEWPPAIIYRGDKLRLAQDGQPIEQAMPKEPSTLPSLDSFLFHLGQASPLPWMAFHVHQNQCVQLNQHLACCLGFERLELLNLAENFLPTLLHPEDQPRFARLVHSLDQAASGVSVSEELRLKHRDGSWRWMCLHCQAWQPSASGKFELFTAVLQDVTQHKQEIQALRNSEETLRNVMDHTPAFIIMVDQQARILFINQVMPEYNYEEVIGSSSLEHLAPESHSIFLRELDFVFTQGKFTAFETTSVVRSGKQHWYLAHLAPMLREGKVVAALLIATDITEQKLAQTALLESKLQLQEQQRHEKELVEAELARLREQLVNQTRLSTLGQIAATIAHELRNPLGAVRNGLYYVRRHLSAGQPEFSEVLSMMQQEVTSAEVIIQNLLEMCRAKQPVLQTVDLAQAVGEAFEQIAKPAEVILRLQLQPEPFSVVVDPGQFQQVLRNLFSNSIQAMPQGGEICIRGKFFCTVVRLSKYKTKVPACSQKCGIDYSNHSFPPKPKGRAWAYPSAVKFWKFTVGLWNWPTQTKVPCSS